ncbi:MAG: hypothetical protein RRY95_03515 [Oscillospiraceae bacterium]
METRQEERVIWLQTKMTGNEYRATVLCIDSYENSILCGRFYNPFVQGAISFRSLMELLLSMEELLDGMNFPQPFTATRSFQRTAHSPAIDTQTSQPEQRGALATFSLRVLFRQNASWQGSVTWQEQHREESFRSVLELLLLLNSALQAQQTKIETPAN